MRVALFFVAASLAFALGTPVARADTTLPNGCVVSTSGTCTSPCAIDPGSGDCKPDNCAKLSAALSACHPGGGSDAMPYFTGCTPDFSADGVCHVMVHGVCDETPETTVCGNFPGCNLHLSSGCNNYVPAAGYVADVPHACATAEYLELEVPAWGASTCTATALAGTPNVQTEFHSWGTTFGAAYSLPGIYNGGLCPPGQKCVIDEQDVIPELIYTCWLENPAHAAMAAAGSPAAMQVAPASTPHTTFLDDHKFARYLDCHDAPDDTCGQPVLSCGKPFTPVVGWIAESHANCPFFTNTAACPSYRCPTPACLTGDHSAGCLCFSNDDCDSGACLNNCGTGGVLIGVCL